MLIFYVISGSGEDVLKVWKIRYNNCDFLFGICLCLISNGCLLFKVRFEILKLIIKILRSLYINYWNSLNINKVNVLIDIILI